MQSRINSVEGEESHADSHADSPILTKQDNRNDEVDREPHQRTRSSGSASWESQHSRGESHNREAEVKDTEERSQAKSPGILGAVYGTVSQFLPKDSSQLQKEREDLQKQLQKKNKQLKQVQVRLEQAESWYGQKLDTVVREHERREEKAQKRWKIEYDNLQHTIQTLQDDLHKANRKVTTLQKRIADNEAVVTKAHATAVSTLAGNVSRGLTDDMVREELTRFFQGDFFSWCADMCVQRISDVDGAMAKLLDVRIINNSDFHLRAPPHLRFDMDMPDGSSPLVLLQASLAYRLCELFLKDAYFLSEQLPQQDGHVNNRSNLCQFEQLFSQVQPDAAINWRIQTVECLEKAVPISPGLFVDIAQAFEEEYGFLLAEMDEEAREDLVRIFTGFANLALKLWKTPTHIVCYGIVNVAQSPFDLGCHWIEVDPALLSTMGRRLNGRPIGLFMRPLIASEPVAKDGKEQQQVVWLKALAWVSCQEGPKEPTQRS